jgi:glyoxylase-like metal-dependent hydrolase (beta-lactamase superfamily II)
MTVKSFTVNPFAENTYVCHDAGQAVVIDPGSSNAYERNEILNYLETNNLHVRHLLLTHGHIDHVIDCAFFAEHFGMAFQMHSEDVTLLERAVDQGLMFGLRIDPPPTPGTLLTEVDAIRFGDAVWQILFCPGHSPGSICFYDADNGFVIGGDVLFQGSIGRTDLWKGSFPQLTRLIREKLFPLPDDTIVYPGHGPSTTIGREKTTNPFLIDQG